MSLSEIGCCGGDHYPTPQIDALARNGTRFEYSYATPLCGPSRCEILAGRYPFRTGLISNQSHNAVHPSREIMLPTVMKTAGYVTAAVGKWGQICLGPGEWGFDEYLVFPGSGRYWHKQTTTYKVNGKETDEVPAQASGYDKIECIYRKMPGWATPTQDVKTVEALPRAAREYLAFIEKETNARVGMISTGPDREQTILVKEFVDELGLKPL